MLKSMSRRAAVVAALTCVSVIGAGVLLAVQASANGRNSAAAGANHPNGPVPARPRAAAAQVRPAVLATNAHCGQTISANLTLNGDLVCTTGDGLTVNSSAAVVLNLNGHTISGPGQVSAVGVYLVTKSATVENGTILGFNEAVQVLGITDTVTNVRMTLNAYGLVDFGTTSKVTNNVAWGNNYIGIYAGSTGGTYSGNHALNNGTQGINVVGSKDVLTSNIANGNTIYGIYDGGYGTTLTKNVANFNGNDGIYVDDLTPTDGAGNTAKGNDFTAGALAEQCRGIVCT